MPGHLIRRLARRLGLRRSRRIAVVYHPSYERSLGGSLFDPHRAAKVMAFLSYRHFIKRSDVHRPLPASLANIIRVHTPEYLESLERTEVLSDILGTPVASGDVGPLLGLMRLHVGGTIEAVRLALQSRGIAVHLGGGFHHAMPDRGMGFCVFNDLAVAIARLRARGFESPVLVVDLDLHDGNGTRAAFAADASVHTFTLHNADWGNGHAVASTSVELGTAVTDDRYLDVLRRTLPPVVEAHQPGLAIYVAGSDVAEDDALGDWRLTAAGVLERDRFVISQLRGGGRPVPVGVVLGGGYGGSAWRYTARFLAWLTSGEVVEPPDDVDMLVRRFRAVLRSWEGRGTSGADWELSEEDILGPALVGEARFLGVLTHHVVELQLERVEVLPCLRRLGFRRPALSLESGATGDTLKVYGDASRSETLIELRVSRSRATIPGAELLNVEWLLLQNPRAAFPAARPKLPGQDHPGLGMLREVIVWLVVLAERLALDGVAFVPAKYHVAAVAHRRFRFADPERQGRFDALAEAVTGRDLAAVTQAIEEGRVVDVQTGLPIAWDPGPMVLAVSAQLRERLEGAAYETARARARAAVAFRMTA